MIINPGWRPNKWKWVSFVLLVNLIGGAIWFALSYPVVTPIHKLIDPTDGKTEVYPGKYEIRLPFDIKNLDVEDPRSFEIHLEPGEENTIYVVVKRTGETGLGFQIELRPKIAVE